ncbi:MAG: hypothetical protein ACFE8N_14035 [Promethearchaeota archaeon]
MTDTLLKELDRASEFMDQSILEKVLDVITKSHQRAVMGIWNDRISVSCRKSLLDY